MWMKLMSGNLLPVKVLRFFNRTQSVPGIATKMD